MSYVNNKIIKKITKPLIALLIGCFFGLLMIEVSLRLFGFFLGHRYLFERLGNNQTNELRILALGESMTYSGVSPYPQQLEEILNSNPLVDRKVKVINGGVPGTASRNIVMDLEENLDRYNPDIVIVMTGINNDGVVDYAKWADVKNDDALSGLKTYKLIKFLYKNLINKINNSVGRVHISNVYADGEGVDDIIQRMKLEYEVKLEPEVKTMTPIEKELYYKLDNLPDNKDQVYLELCSYYKGRGETNMAVSSAIKALSINSNNFRTYVQLADFVSFPARKTFLLKALELNPNNDYVYEGLADQYIGTGEMENEKLTYEKGLSFIPHSELLLYDLGKFYFRHDNFVEAEKVLSEALQYGKNNDNKNPHIYQLLAKIYQSQNRTDKAEKVLGLAVESNIVLKSNLNIIAKILKERGIVFIAMQYPMRDVNLLKNILSDLDVIYVDNEESFKNVVEKDGYSSIFEDLFAGDFGHGTTEGNRIMANNVASVILEKVLLVENK